MTDSVGYKSIPEMHLHSSMTAVASALAKATAGKTLDPLYVYVFGINQADLFHQFA